jgi:hypothetical protein
MQQKKKGYSSGMVFGLWSLVFGLQTVQTWNDKSMIVHRPREMFFYLQYFFKYLAREVLEGIISDLSLTTSYL